MTASTGLPGNKDNYPKEVFLNGNWMPASKAFVSVFDRGFMFGDGIYEVIPFYRGKAFRFQDHFDRIKYCLGAIHMEADLEKLQKVAKKAVTRAGLQKEDCAVYLQFTRGVAPRTHHFPQESTTTVLIYAYPVTLEGFETKRANVLVSKDLRWHRCDIKSISLMANVKANDKAIKLGLDENLLVRKGYFTEGSHSSIFFVKHNKLHTHPEGPHILSGITRKVIMEICERLKIEVIEKAVHIDELVEVDEVFLTGTTTQVKPVKTMYYKEEDIFTGPENGKIIGKIQQAFLELTRNSL